jgi:hypothetical protein
MIIRLTAPLTITSRVHLIVYLSTGRWLLHQLLDDPQHRAEHAAEPDRFARMRPVRVPAFVEYHHVTRFAANAEGALTLAVPRGGRAAGVGVQPCRGFAGARQREYVPVSGVTIPDREPEREERLGGVKEVFSGLQFTGMSGGVVGPFFEGKITHLLSPKLAGGTSCQTT